MIPVIIESPYAGEHKTNNLIYLQECIHYSVNSGEAPFASHRMYTGALNDDVPEERKLGIEAGYCWMNLAKKVIFCVDEGMSEGMKKALITAVKLEKDIVFRYIRRDATEEEE